MAGLYLDTSALGRVLLGEHEADSILDEMARFDEHVSSRLLAVELRRIALRKGRLDHAAQLLSRVSLVPVDEPVLEAAESVPPSSVATLDAIHLVTALRLAANDDVQVMMTYDVQLADGARRHELAVVAPEP